MGMNCGTLYARSNRRANHKNGLFLRLIIVFNCSVLSVLKEVNCYPKGVKILGNIFLA